LSKKDRIFSFEQIICNVVARREQVGAYTLGVDFGGTPTHFAVKQYSVFKQKFRPKHA